MALNLVMQLGEWNPQMFRELKGRLKPRNILITGSNFPRRSAASADEFLKSATRC
jgi:hypothetical protein